jgi:alpha-1,2-mannosyltransferase
VRIRRLWAVACVLALAVQVVSVARQWRFYQYDFRAYYFAPRLARAGLDPYSERAMFDACRAAGLADNVHPFLYPPHMVAAFTPLSWLPFPAAYFGWMLLELAALVVLARATLRSAAAGGPGALLVALTALAFSFNGSVAASLRAGQIGLIAAALVVLGVELWERQRAGSFVAAVTAAALPKFWPGALLSLGAVERRRAAFLACAGGAATLLLVHALDRWLWPDYSRSFATAAVGLASGGNVSGPQNGSFLNFWLSLLGGRVASPWLIWLPLAVVVVGGTVVACWRNARRDLSLSAAACLLGLMLLLPRVMIYEWCIVLPSMVLVMSRTLSPRKRLALLGLSLFPGVYLRRTLLHVDMFVPALGAQALWTFTNLWTVVGLWAAAVWRLARVGVGAASQVESAPGVVIATADIGSSR